MDAIRHRRPNEEDADRTGSVLVWMDDEWFVSYYKLVKAGTPWRPIEQSPLRGEGKVKRERHFFRRKRYLEIRPGDPKDLDTLLDIVDSVIEAWRETDDRLAIFDTAAALASLEAARHGEGGDA